MGNEMSKAKTISIPTDVQRAGQALAQASRVREELKAALNAALQSEQRLAHELLKARTASDLAGQAGPLATILPPRGAWPSNRGQKVVVVRRTASAVWTRPVGLAAEGNLQQWRKSKSKGGAWAEYPAGYYAVRTLTIDGEDA
jgi:hypothetical protein